MTYSFGMENCKCANTPMPLGMRLERPFDGDCIHSLPYQQIIGGLMYLSLCTRLDITYVTGMLSQFKNYQNEDHWNLVRGDLKYLKCTSSFGFVYEKSGKGMEDMLMVTRQVI